MSIQTSKKTFLAALLVCLLVGLATAGCANRSDSGEEARVTVQGQYDVAFSAGKGF